ncbi:DUF3040 domain-containing protein [Pseudonocardia hispaniensis]|uniref:DUF3040 domain-containing protein n=1 Tax=Pseudonocardia hispaniensis TaxID=904933 RepID=A0ABW1J386_9PSEU
MLSDHERKSLRAVEDLLIADDPVFAASFRRAQQRLSGTENIRLLTIATCVSVGATLVLLLLSLPVLALITSGASMYFSWRRADAIFARQDR